jgi:hypothetical protein
VFYGALSMPLGENIPTTSSPAITAQGELSVSRTVERLEGLQGERGLSLSIEVPLSLKPP